MIEELVLIYLNILKEYIHRVGRTARGADGKGHALLILRPEELGFLRYLKQARIPLNEFEFSWNKIADIQLQVSIIYMFFVQISILYILLHFDCELKNILTESFLIINFKFKWHPPEELLGVYMH